MGKKLSGDVAKIRSDFSDWAVNNSQNLTAHQRDGHVLVHGQYDLKFNGAVIDTFDIRIYFPPEFPSKPPIVFEDGGRIPKIIDRHIFPASGSCCLGIHEMWLVSTECPCINSYMDGPFRDYFLSQLEFERSRIWPFDHHPHGPEAHIIAYANVLEVESEAEVVNHWLDLLTMDWPKGHWLCPCGNGKTIRNCRTKKAIRLHKKIPPKLALQMKSRLLRLLENAEEKAN